LDAAEARPEESEHVAAPRTDAANKTDLKLFMRTSICFRAWIPCDRRARSSLRAPGAFSRKGDQLSVAPERARTSRAGAQNVSRPVGDQENRESAACHRELPSPSARQEMRIIRACYDVRTMGPVMPSDDDDLGARSDCPTSGKDRTAVAPDSPNRLSTKPSSPTASASISCVLRPGIQALSTAPSLLRLQRTRPSDSPMPTDISPDVDPRA
jgi:hypothetical protein